LKREDLKIQHYEFAQANEDIKAIAEAREKKKAEPSAESALKMI